MNAGRELDALVAEKVMGWVIGEKRITRPDGSSFDAPECGMPEDDVYRSYSIPAYSTSIADAWLVFCKFPSRYLGYDDATDMWFCSLDTTRRVMGDCRFRATSEDDTGALAICLAALRVRGYEWWRVHDATR